MSKKNIFRFHLNKNNNTNNIEDEIKYFQSQNIKNVKNIQNVAENKWVLAIGNFDGVHLGHQLLLNEVKNLCDELNYNLNLKNLQNIKENTFYKTGVLSFFPHPRKFFAALNSETQKFIHIQKFRDYILRLQSIIDDVFLFNFKNIYEQDAEQFLNYLQALNICAIVVGEDFRCGHQRATDAFMLQKLAENYNIQVKIIPFLKHELPVTQLAAHEKISSRHIKSLLQQANFNQSLIDANACLGYAFTYTARIIKGQCLGRTLGFATLNMSLKTSKNSSAKISENSFILPAGVYASYTYINGTRYESISNLGLRPTVDGAYLLETHITDENFKETTTKKVAGFDDDNYPTGYVSIEFTAYIRGQKKFNGLDELKAAIAADILMRKNLI